MNKSTRKKPFLIVVLDNKIIIPYSVGMNIDGGLVLTRSVPERRLAGTIMATIRFASTGYPERIVTKALNMEFDSNGRPVIDPLPELGFPLD